MASKPRTHIRSWLKRRSQIDGGSMLVPRRKGRLRRKSINLITRLAVILLSLRYRKYRNPPHPSVEKTSSVLLIPHDPIGDLIITSPLWTLLRNRNPDMRIGIGVSNRNREVLDEENIDARYTLYGNFFRVCKELRRARRHGWDVVLTTAGFYKPTRFAFISRCIAKDGITATMHSSRVKRYSRVYSFCFARPSEPERIPMAEQYQQLLEKVFSISFEPEERIPHFTFSGEAGETIRKKLAGIMKNHYDRLILINLEAKVPQREWGLDNVLALSTLVKNSYPTIGIVATASAEFRNYYDVASKIQGSNIVVLPTDSIHELAAAIAAADIVISPDTAVVHLAAALKKKLIGFYPSPDEWLPYRNTSLIFYPERWQPFSTIDVGAVYDAIQSFLETSGQ